MDSLLPFLEGYCIPYNMPVHPGCSPVGPSCDQNPLSRGTPAVTALSRYCAPAMRAVFWVEFTFPSLINPVGFRSRTRLGRQNASYPTAKSWIVGNSEAIQTCL